MAPVAKFKCALFFIISVLKFIISILQHRRNFRVTPAMKKINVSKEKRCVDFCVRQLKL